MIYKFILILSLIFISSCAQDTKEIEPYYVSPMEYRGYNCQQLEVEMVQTSNQALNISKDIKNRVDHDTGVVIAAIFINASAIHGLKGDNNNTYRYSKLKGEYEALQKAAEKKNCEIDLNKYPMEEVKN